MWAKGRFDGNMVEEEWKWCGGCGIEGAEEPQCNVRSNPDQRRSIEARYAYLKRDRELKGLYG